jgi:hypothetical protein
VVEIYICNEITRYVIIKHIKGGFYSRMFTHVTRSPDKWKIPVHTTWNEPYLMFTDVPCTS